ncbi:MAG: MarR family winged helix-turn-helix transcriptional regulator [Mycobacteriaceae bacterium]
MTSSDSRLAGDLSLAVVRLTRHLRGRHADSSVSLTQLSAMSTLSREGAMTPGVLAARERVQPPSMTRVIASLADMGLVDRTPHPTDGRQVIVSLSDAGARIIANETSAREKWLKEQLAKFDSEQLEMLRRATDVISAIVNDAE